MRTKRLLAIGVTVSFLLGMCACGKNTDNNEPVAGESEISEPLPYVPTEEFQEEEYQESDFFENLEEFYYMDGFSPKEVAGLLFRDDEREKLSKMAPVMVDLSKPENFVSMEKEGDEIRAFALKLSGDKTISFASKGIVQDEDGTINMLPGGYINSLSEIEGLIRLDIYSKTEFAEDEYGWLNVTFGLSPTDVKEISDSDELIYGLTNHYALSNGVPANAENYGQFGFFHIENENDENINISQFDVFSTGEHHGIGEVALDPVFYGRYAEGSYYDPGREKFILDESIFDFYLLIKSDVKDHYDYDDCVVFGTENYKIGDLRDKDGNIKAKTEPLALGDTLDVDLGGKVFSVSLPVCKNYYPKNYYEASKTSVTNAVGDLNVLVVPVRFEDQRNQSEGDMETLITALGNVVTKDGTKYASKSEEGYFTLSDYYKQASYGKLNITSYITDWYEIDDGTYQDWCDSDRTDREAIKIQSWVNKNYSDWKDILDSDLDGLFDAVIFANASSPTPRDEYNIISFGGAFRRNRGYGHCHNRNGETAINGFVNISIDFLFDKVSDKNSGMNANTMIHEFGHGLGLIDYYDVTGMGYNAVGGFDMQSDNVGDWNPYSKFAVGWTKPTVLTTEDIGDGITVTISDFETSGDTIIIPTDSAKMNADGTLCPFNEYIMVDLFSPTGLNVYDASKYGLTKSGVRMYHVDGRLCEIDYSKDWLEEGITYDMLYTNAYSKTGKYHIQLLQSGGKNTFTKGTYRAVNNSDLFFAGDSFNIKKYSSVFLGGKMNNGQDFPYDIKVTEISDGTATITVSPLK